MPVDLRDMPRPPSDNGRGLHGSAAIGWSGGNEGVDYWIGELIAMGCKWFKVLDDGGDSLSLCEKLLESGIFPIVRILRKDPPPNDTPEPNPGHIGSREEDTIKRLIGAGVRYFETNHEPNLGAQWKHNAMPRDPIETAKLVALNWLFDARLILEAGGLPGLPAVSVGDNLDLMGALVALGRQDILLEGCWVAIHNYNMNHPLAYPDDPVNRSGQQLSQDQYDQGPLTQWAWWNNERGCADSLEEINESRASDKNPTLPIAQDHSCFREFEYYNFLANKYLGRSIPIISTENGILIGRREDNRYPRITPDAHRDQTVAMFDFMQRQAPDYYFAAMPWLLVESAGRAMDAWHSSYWKQTFKNGSDGRNGIPPIPVSGIQLGDHLPVVDAVKSMPKLARRLPGAQPEPPVEEEVQPPVAAPRPSTVLTPPPAPELGRRKYVVVPGDTLGKIARQFGVTTLEMAELNSIANSNLIRPGQVLLIPEAHPSVPSDKSLPRAPAPRPVAPPAPPIASRPHQAAPTFNPERVPTPPSEKTEPRPAWTTSFPTVPPPPVPPAGSTPISAAKPTKSETEPIEETDARRSGTSAPSSTAPLSVSALFSLLPTPKLDWDPRLDAMHISLQPADVPPGQMYWKLIRADYNSPSEAQGKHHIFFAVEDEKGQPVEYQRVWQGWPEDKTDATTNDKGEANIPLWASYSPERGEGGQYSAWVDGLPSDRVAGMGLPQKRQVSFILTWRRVVS